MCIISKAECALLHEQLDGADVTPTIYCYLILAQYHMEQKSSSGITTIKSLDHSFLEFSVLSC